MPVNTTTVRALIAPDKFKGSLTAGEVAQALAAGLRSTAGAAGAIECELLPLADGGDGSVDAAVSAGFARHTCSVTGPTGQRVQSSIAFDGVTAVVEVANTCGIALLADGSLDALNASSRGFGEAVRFALGLSPARIVLALGGSASTDGGMGMLSALGYAFLAADGTVLPGTGHALGSIHAVRGSLLPGLAGTELVVASDVSNPLTGPAGAAAVFGPQKGAGPADVAALDAGLEHFVGRMADAGFGAAASLARHDGAGSAGGIGFACLLLGARQVSGADFFLDLLDFDARKAGCDVVITGEGSIDAQTLAGKLPAAVARRSGTRTLIAVAGRSLLPRERWADLSLAQVYALADYTSRDSAKDPLLSAALLTRIGRDIGRQIGQGIRQPGTFVPSAGSAGQ
ncbi:MULTISPECIES: glycerate kinase [unclassified Pseudarthrobacter]|uniref:glycerate kinase n=1 Tax=unclassified Pseudarthrobacter TaxID=2647000 RepID=UPI0011328241|nr:MULTISPECIES: glycerate kinase [unclassified Pseudarthrobacter]QDG61596.1 glycerate kinase [Pseudarthrobacter sp. NIBRBAC000502771]QDG90335.1 glycerate kinase [Pseudarthrobacter sp. NIBRBAC000502770]